MDGVAGGRYGDEEVCEEAVTGKLDVGMHRSMSHTHMRREG